MLDALDEVAWAKLTHAYGNAEDVPDLLRGLLSKSAKERGKAIFQLNASLCHQGTLYTATAKAIPSLVELVASPKVKARERILKLLAEIASLDDHERFLLQGIPLSLGDLPVAFKRAVTAVRDEAETFGTLLTDKDAAVRSWAAFVLAWIPGAAATSAPLVKAALVREKDDTAKASLMLTLAHLDSSARFEAELGAKAIAIRTAAALATSHVKRGELDERVRTILGAAAAKKTLVAAGLPWCAGNLASFAVQIIAALPRTEETDGYLVAAMEARGSAGMFASNALVRRLFPTQPSPAKDRKEKTKATRRDKKDDALLAAVTVERAKLTPLQRRALIALGAETGFDNDLVGALEERGLPTSAPLMKRWIVGATTSKASLLDREVPFEGGRKSLGDLVVAATDGKGGVNEAPFAAVQAALSAEEQVTLARKVLEDIDVPWSNAITYELLWRSAAKGRTAIDGIKPIARQGHSFAVAVGIALAAVALADGTPADPSVDKLLQQAYGFYPRVRDALTALPTERREKWLLNKNRDDQGQPAAFFKGAWPYWPAAPTTKIADRALAHVAKWKPNDPWGGKRELYAEPQLETLIAAFEKAGNGKDAKRLAEALATLRIANRK